MITDCCFQLALFRFIATTAPLAAAVLVCVSLSSGAAPRASESSCREAANGLISLLDAKTDTKTDNTALYRDTYNVVVNTCGPIAQARQPTQPPRSRDACHDLAAALVDLIEDGKMNTNAFVKARGDFAAACRPR